MTERTNLPRWVGVALGVHGLALAWVPRQHPASGPAFVELPMLLSEVEVESPPVVPPSDVAAADSAETLDSPRLVAARASSITGPLGESARSPATDAAAMPVAPESDGSWSFSPTDPPASSTRLAGLGLGSALGAGVRETVAESTRRERAERSNAPVFTAHDIELGLVPGSNLIGLTRERVRIGLTPTNGHAVLEFHLDGSGVVASVQVVDASSDRADWDDVATRLVRDAHDVPPARMPTGARGLTLTLSVDSSERTVSGSAPTRNGITKALRAINDPIDTVIDGKSPVQRVVAVRIVGAQAF